MNDNIVHISNTPIFDELANARGIERFLSDEGRRKLSREDHCSCLQEPVRESVRQSPPPSPTYVTPESWIPRPVPALTPKPEPSNVYSKETLPKTEQTSEPEYLIADFLRDSYRDFYRDYPNAVITDVQPERGEDGEITMVINAVEPKQEEQTDDYVNAATSNDVPPHQHAGSRPLRFVEDDAHEE